MSTYFGTILPSLSSKLSQTPGVASVRKSASVGASTFSNTTCPNVLSRLPGCTGVIVGGQLNLIFLPANPSPFKPPNPVGAPRPGRSSPPSPSSDIVVYQS